MFHHNYSCSAMLQNLVKQHPHVFLHHPHTSMNVPQGSHLPGTHVLAGWTRQGRAPGRENWVTWRVLGCFLHRFQQLTPASHASPRSLFSPLLLSGKSLDRRHGHDMGANEPAPPFIVVPTPWRWVAPEASSPCCRCSVLDHMFRLVGSHGPLVP